MLLFSVFDKKVSEYMQPFVFPNTVAALRGLTASLKSKDSNPAQYPHDFALYEVGVFNTKLGIIVPNNPPHFVEEIANLVPQKGGVE